MGFRLVSLLLISSAGAGWLAVTARPSREPAIETRAVTRGDFVRQVKAVGEVRTFRPATVYNDCRWHLRQIIEVVPEGTWVEKGDVVLRLDCSELEDILQKQRIEQIRNESRLKVAQKQEELQQVHNARRLAGGEQAADAASARLQAFRELEDRLEERRLKQQILLARQRLDQTLNDFDVSRNLVASGYRDFSSLAGSSASAEQAQRQLDSSRRAASLNRNHASPRTRLELEGNADYRQSNRLRIDMQCDLADAVTRTNTLTREKWLHQIDLHMDYIQRAIAACTVRAPESGEVVYSHRPESNRWIEVGEWVYYTQELFAIDDRSRLKVAAQVSDREYYSLAEGQPAEIRVSVIPDTTFAGHLTWVGSIPIPASPFEPHLLHHKLEILIDQEFGRGARLFPGMNADVSIIADYRSDVLQIPSACAAEDSDRMLTVVRDGESMALREITIGATNEDSLEVLSGLDAGEQVVFCNSRHELRHLIEDLSTQD